MPFFFLYSCGGDAGIENAEDDQIDSTGNKEVVEYELDQTRLSAVEFNNELSLTEENALITVDALFASDSTSIDQNLDNAIFEMDMNLQKINSLQLAGEGQNFKNTLIDLLEFYQTEFTGDFKAIAILIKKPDWTKKDEEDIETYDKDFAAKEEELRELIHFEQDKYAAANNIKLTDR